MFIPAAKATVLIPTPTERKPDLRHLFIVLNNAMKGLHATIEDGVIATGVTSIQQGRYYDNSCVLYRGDHPFIRHDSYVNYVNCKVYSAAALLRGIKDGKLIPRGPMDDVVFARVLYGVLKSPRTPQEIQDAFRVAYPDA